MRGYIVGAAIGSILWVLIFSAIGAWAEPITEKAIKLGKDLDKINAEGQAYVDYFDEVVMPWLDEQEKQRKQRGRDERVHPRRSFRGDDVGFNNRDYLLMR